MAFPCPRIVGTLVYTRGIADRPAGPAAARATKRCTFPMNEPSSKLGPFPGVWKQMIAQLQASERQHGLSLPADSSQSCFYEPLFNRRNLSEEKPVTEVPWGKGKKNRKARPSPEKAFRTRPLLLSLFGTHRSRKNGLPSRGSPDSRRRPGPSSNS